MNYLIRWAGWELAKALRAGAWHKAHTPVYLYDVCRFLHLPKPAAPTMHDIPCTTGYIICFGCGTLHSSPEGTLVTKTDLCPACEKPNPKKAEHAAVCTDVTLMCWARVLQELHARKEGEKASLLVLQALILIALAEGLERLDKANVAGAG